MTAVLQIGSAGFEVAKLQLQLNLLSIPTPPLKVDGGFGPLTRAAVVNFQRRGGLQSDGVVGPLTQAALARGPAIRAVHHAVRHLAQPTETTCWATSTAMLTNTSVHAVRTKTPASMLAPNGGLLNSSESHQAVVTGMQYGAIHGLLCNAPMSWSVGGLLDRLERSPLMIDMLWNAVEYMQGNGSPGHMVVVSAAVSDGAPDGERTHLLVLDPWKPLVGKVYWVSYAAWVRDVPTRTYRVFERA